MITIGDEVTMTVLTVKGKWITKPGVVIDILDDTAWVSHIALGVRATNPYNIQTGESKISDFPGRIDAK